MIGVDLVADPTTREPATELASEVMNEMRERGVLISTTGPAANVLKIRPPLVITPGEAEIIAATLDQALAAAGA
jgi:4-aminobutyrate aminotransferase-like enzyme